MQSLAYLEGGGEMGALIRKRDWSPTPLGPYESWPHGLRTALGICLGLPCPIVIWWGRELVMLYNDACRPMLGAAGHPMALGRPGRECWPEMWHIVEPMLEQTVLRGQATSSGDQLLRLDRIGGLEDCYVTFASSPIYDESGGIGGAFCAVIDTTARVLAQRSLAAAQAARRDADAANRTKDQFLALVSHELRNPLAPIMTALELMRLRGGEAFQQERRIIERQVRHLLRLIDDLLDASRLMRGRVTLDRRPVVIGDVIARSIQSVSPALEKRGQRVDVRAPAGGLTVAGDERRLTQVFAHLLTNAARHSEANALIQVFVERCEGDVRVRVRDFGAGIDAGLLPRIFDLFAQPPQGLDRAGGAGGGLGLGLTIVRNLVTLHGGSVGAGSEGPGRGSEFIVTLPCIPPAVAAPAAACSPAPRPERPRRILLVDDNEDAAHVLSTALAELGHSVVVAHDAPAALRALDGTKADVALIDIGLPVMDGFELADRLRILRPELPLVALTAYGRDADRDRGRDAGFVHHLVKPVDLQTLVDLLAAVSPARA